MTGNISTGTPEIHAANKIHDRQHIQRTYPGRPVQHGGIWTGQGIQLLGMPTEAIHTPFMSDRYLAIENARYIFKSFKDIGKEVEFAQGGIIRRRAGDVLDNAYQLLENVKEEGLFTALEKGIFAGVRRPREGGKGLDGVTRKSSGYVNPFIELLKGKR